MRGFSGTGTTYGPRFSLRRGWLGRTLWMVLLGTGCGPGGSPADPMRVETEVENSAENFSRLPDGFTAEEWRQLELLSPGALPAPPSDVSNMFADDLDAAWLGQRLFFDPRFSGQLLESDNDGMHNGLGFQGETGKVSCAGCHLPEDGFSGHPHGFPTDLFSLGVDAATLAFAFGCRAGETSDVGRSV